MTSKLTELAQNKSAAQLQMMSRDSIRWLNNKVTQLKNPGLIRRDIASEKDRYRNKFLLGTNTKFLLGGLYFFYYNPKTKDELPYYDMFPLVMPIEKYSDGFLGLNLHYLPVPYRIRLMRKLLPLAMYDGDDIRRIRITYDILDASRRYREFRPCIKKYLLSNIKSKIVKVESEEWDTALFIPVHQFKKAQPQTVWKESVEEIRNS